MRCTLVALALAVLPSPLLALSRDRASTCPRLEVRLAELEAETSSPADERRLRRLRSRINDRCVALNEVQVLGSHNSYHIQPRPRLFDLLVAFDPLFLTIEYTHSPLDEQFATQGIRQIELDVFADPAGGLYARRGALIVVGENPDSGIPALGQPGFKVLHIQDVDFESTCLTFVECLQTIRRWSDRNRRHLPLMVLVEAKDDPIPDPLNLDFAVPVPIGATELDALDEEIRAVFPPNRLVTPDDVRRGRLSLEDAIALHGWPTLGWARGRVLFALDNGGGIRDAYVAGHPGLAGRVLFTDSPRGTPEAAFQKVNDPDPVAIPELVRAGYIVRTRADADTLEARSGDGTRRDVALATGAQYVSTDYPVPDPDFGTGYAVRIPDGAPGRCNPVNGPPGCRTAALEQRR